MANRLRPVELDFIDSAPVRLVFTRDMSATPDAVFHALNDDVPGWAEWFSAVTSARSLDDGSRRDIRLKGGGHFLETVIAAKAAEVYAYRIDVTNAPGARAMAEEWRLIPVGGGTRVQWTFAADGTAVFKGVVRVARPGLGRAFREAVTALDRRLAG
ncbi:SRPBCC family protein [Streptomyces sp. MBT65]|uniref:SRPBCC family protein n=1 Tax=Streptomyces sp. MBT65 TaxID=1488395 RepID=UPI0019094B88|nr:SRPBCC family protein [Streptomyces sp. MBT65]MBK3580326.1 SRPBCC family protein [Streptomyces sp. MBT65]